MDSFFCVALARSTNRLSMLGSWSGVNLGEGSLHGGLQRVGSTGSGKFSFSFNRSMWMVMVRHGSGYRLRGTAIELAFRALR